MAKQHLLLFVDLTNRKWEKISIKGETFGPYPGGRGLALKLWQQYSAEYGRDTVVFACGFLSDYALPLSGGCSAAYVAPETSEIYTCSDMGSFGHFLNSTGFDAVVITGTSSSLVYLSLSSKGALFLDAAGNASLTTSEVRNNLEVKGISSVLAVGPAAFRNVAYSSVVCDGYSVSRGGLGLLLAKKGLKGIAAFGKPEPRTNSVTEGFFRRFSSSHYFWLLQRDGTLDIFRHSDRAGFIPLENFRYRSDPRTFHLRGCEVRRCNRLVHKACPQCPAQCRCALDTGKVIPPYSATVMLGANLNNFAMSEVTQAYNMCCEFGMDPVSLGNILAWSKDAAKQALLPRFQFPSTFGAVQDLIYSVAYGSTAIGRLLAGGLRSVTAQFGLENCAYHINGLECGPYDYRGTPAQSVFDSRSSDSVAVREILMGCRTRNAKASASVAVSDEILVHAFDSMGICRMGIPEYIWRYLSYNLNRNRTILNNVPLFLQDRYMDRRIGKLERRLSRLTNEEYNLKTVALNSILLEDSLRTSHPNLPEHFTADAESNNPRDNTVDFINILEEYELRKGAAIVKNNKERQKREKK